MRPLRAIGLLVVAGAAVALAAARSVAQDAPAADKSAAAPSAATAPGSGGGREDGQFPTSFGGGTAGGLADTAPPATAATKPASRPVDPLETPTSALEFVFKRIRAEDVDGVRDAVIDPPPANQLAPAIHRIASNLSRGATWTVVESKVQGTAAAVLYRSKYLSGNEEVQPALLLNRYDRWKMVLGALDPKRLTSIERQDIRVVMEWAKDRMKAYPAVTTQPTSQPTTAAATQATTAPAAPK